MGRPAGGSAEPPARRRPPAASDGAFGHAGAAAAPIRLAVAERRRAARRSGRRGRRQRPEPAEGGEKRLCPGPAPRQAKPGAPARADHLAGDVEEALAQALRLGPGELAVEAEDPRPGEQVLGRQGELEPGLVVVEAVEGEVSHPRVLAGADLVLDPGAVAVAELERGDVLIGLVGDEAGVAVAVGVEDLELGPGVRALAADDQPRSGGPTLEADAVAQLPNPGALPLFALALNRLLP